MTKKKKCTCLAEDYLSYGGCCCGAGEHKKMKCMNLTCIICDMVGKPTECPDYDTCPDFIEEPMTTCEHEKEEG